MESGIIHQEEEGFVQIFDGATLEGWEGDPSYWHASNGILTGEVTPEALLESNTFIIWQGGLPTDFELKLEFLYLFRGLSFEFEFDFSFSKKLNRELILNVFISIKVFYYFFERIMIT